MSKVQSLDQERAAFAWAHTDPAHIHKYDDFAKLAAGAPALIMANGLMQTLAFYRAKNQTSLLKPILEWLAKRVLDTRDDFERVMAKLHGTDSDSYMRATEEALELLKWIRQFAKARGAQG
ncbi:MAG: type III-B CRISPR module-associated protein Cmr5, partial [Myxococcota bacterium]